MKDRKKMLTQMLKSSLRRHVWFYPYIYNNPQNMVLIDNLLYIERLKKNVNTNVEIKFKEACVILPLHFDDDIKWIIKCNHNQMNQQWQRIQPQMGPLWTFWLFHKKEFLKDLFCNIFLKLITILPKNYIICVNSF